MGQNQGRPVLSTLPRASLSFSYLTCITPPRDLENLRKGRLLPHFIGKEAGF